MCVCARERERERERESWNLVEGLRGVGPGVARVQGEERVRQLLERALVQHLCGNVTKLVPQKAFKSIASGCVDF